MLELINKIPKDITTGLIGASKSLAIANLSPDLVITATYEYAARIKHEIELLTGKTCHILPPLNIVPGEEIPVSKELIGERLRIISAISKGERPIVIAPLRAVATKTSKAVAEIKIEKNGAVDRDGLVGALLNAGYKRTPIVGECGEFSVRGGILDVFAPNLATPIRVELGYEKIDSIRSFDPNTQRSVAELDEAEVLPVFEEPDVPIFYHLPKDARVLLDEPIEINRARERFYQEVKEFGSSGKVISYEDILARVSAELTSFDAPGRAALFSSPPQFFGRIEDLNKYLSEKAGAEIYIVSKHSDRLEELTGKKVVAGELSSGFEINGVLLLTDHEIFGETARFAKPKKAAKDGINESLLADLKIGDYVVHEQYGIGIYRGMRRMEEVEGEHLLIEYANEDKLYVPLTMLGLVGKYSAADGAKTKLSRLGSVEWAKTKSKVKRSIKDMTKELLTLYASRNQASGFAFPPDDIWQKELEGTFPYEETPDQIKAINEVKRDMESARPMDRLICGDVGYGKTEVALRAAAKAAAAGKQVAVLVPTTILAEQHYNNFKERFRSLPFKVEMVSRLKSKAEQKQVIEGLAAGSVDVVIGTHRLISKDIKFRDLGLLVIDEEHRFGVSHKEKLKHLRRSIDVLTLSATPIPRTLYFSLSGARDLSMISTPPVDRSPVRTYVLAWNESIAREAALREIDRGGQIFFVYNRVERIDEMAYKLKKLIPEANIGIGHGQMKDKQLEEAMSMFLSRENDILLCSTIIESGIDITNANTIIIDEADRFGLAQLYQLRGRVGRSTSRAYAYLFYHPETIPTSGAVERLKAIQEYTALGSGYKLAMRDLEIRGAGNLLGAEQHGHMLAVGFDMYCELLEETVREIKGVAEPTPKQVEIDLKDDVFIPSGYIEDENQRIAVYRKMNLIEKKEELLDLKEELKDRFGPMPGPLENLFEIIEIKTYAIGAGVRSIKEKAGTVRIEYLNGSSKTFAKTDLKEIKSRVLK